MELVRTPWNELLTPDYLSQHAEKLEGKWKAWEGREGRGKQGREGGRKEEGRKKSKDPQG